ncbi:MAG: NAD(P)H-hydrate dehydratase [Lachnospiraceae bacterium]|nr:NAD(P)H-hydrate dehydratase [Lachnospiraceae bacterium]
MEYLLNARQMKACDQRTIHTLGIPSLVLMERAALAVVEEMKAFVPDLSNVLVICGSGNNGGDGFAVARLLAEESRKKTERRVTIAFVGKETSMSEETALQRRICENCQLKISSNFMEDEYTVIVDAIFGIGLSRPVEGRYAEIIHWVNAQKAAVVSVDIPSGLSADNGLASGAVVRADLTVTFGARKIGQILYPGAAYCGKLVCRDIGIRTDASIELDKTSSRVFTYSESDLMRIPKRSPYSNKGTYGKVLLIAGSEGMSGAALLAAKSALRGGCGMVRVFTPECNRTVLQTCLPEAMVTAWEPGNLKPELLAQALAWSDVAGIGPGLGTSADAADLLRFVLEQYEKPLVIDADALNILSVHPELLELAHGSLVMTPHVGEMSRLVRTNKALIAEDLIAYARAFAARQQVVCVLKDARTVVSDGEQIYLNTSGNDGMATAGSGDVLTGVICALLAQGLSCFEAGALGVYVHGLAGDRACDALGAYGMLSGDIAERVGEVLRMRS